MKYTSLACCGAVAAAFGASSAAAQVSADSMSHGGLARSMKIEADVAIEHDSNVLRSAPSAFVTPGARPDETEYTPSISVNILTPIGRQAVFVNGSVGYTFHQNNPNLNSDRINITAGAGGSVGRCGGVASGSLFRGRSQLYATALIVSAENLQDVKRIDASVSCSTSGGLGAFVTASRDWTSNSLSAFTGGDSRSTSVSGGLSYGRPSSGTVSLFTSFSRTEFSNQGLAMANRGFESTSVGASFNRRIGGRIEANASVGYSKIMLTGDGPQLAGAPAISRDRPGNLTYSAKVDFRASSRLKLHASLDRNITPDILAGSSYQIGSNYSVNADYQLGTRISLGFGGSYGTTDAGAPALAFPGAIAPTNSRVNTIFGSVRYQQSRRLSVVLNAKEEKQTANLPQFDFTNDQVGLTLAVNF